MICAFPARVSKETTRPCGKCHPCRENRRRKWQLRLELEAKAHEHTLFITLTYAPEHQPTCIDPNSQEELGTLRKADLITFLKAIQRSASTIPSSTNFPGKPGRYYACAEYGTKTERPHYHAILFGLEPTWHETIEKTWKHGFVSTRTADRSSLRYTLKYCLKNESDPDSPWLRGRQPTFALMSKQPPLGTSYLPLVAQMLKKTAFDSQDNPLCEIPKVLRIDGELLPLDRTMLEYLKRELNLEEHQEAAAFPRIIQQAPTDAKASQALNKHKKAWLRRKAQKGYSV